jgi:hypothetical protein
LRKLGIAHRERIFEEISEYDQRWQEGGLTEKAGKYKIEAVRQQRTQRDEGHHKTDKGGGITGGETREHVRHMVSRVREQEPGRQVQQILFPP